MRNKVVVFGLGKIFETFIRVYEKSQIDIIALCDNNRTLAGSKRYGYNVVLPEELPSLRFEYILVTSSYYNDIKNQLMKIWGGNPEKIIDLSCLAAMLNVGLDFGILDWLNQETKTEIITRNQKTYTTDLKQIKSIEEKNLFLSAKNFICNHCNRKVESLEEIEFKVFSQFGEDGIIQWLIHNTKIDNKVFVEFGVEDYKEANTRFLLMNNNWSGLIIDGDKNNIDKVEKWEDYWKYDLLSISAFITKDNINSLIEGAGIIGDIGLLSVDVDGNDYWILDAITCISPRILICEYNNIYGSEKRVTIPYDAEFVRSQKHYSYLYWGVSLRALQAWAEEHNYYYVGSNSAGNNAFFVRKDCFEQEKIPANCMEYKESKYRESRDKNGQMNYLRGKKRLEEIKDMELIDLESGRRDTIRHIYQL